MGEPQRYLIEPISKGHDRKGFDCGHPFLNEYLRQFARQNDDNGIARAFVMLPEQGNPVVGYYTLSAAEIAFENIPADAAQRLPRYPIPAARIGELAVDVSCQGLGLGSQLLLDALERIVAASEDVAVWAVVVEPIDQQAASFYQRFDFEPMLDSATMFLSMRDVVNWVVE